MYDLDEDVPAQAVLDTVRFHSELNPKLFDDDVLIPRVRLKLIKAAREFKAFLDVAGLRVSDVLLTGSNAAFNYTDVSDIDVHLLVDFSELADRDLADNLFTAKKSLWGLRHAISIRGLTVEFYVEDVARPATSNGVYSILRDEWVRYPDRTPPSYDDGALLSKVQDYARRIEDALEAEDAQAVDAIVDSLYRMRQAGLADGGEFSVENLTFKSLRSLGYVDALKTFSRAQVDRSLSLESQ